MNFGSFCTGIGAPEVAWSQLGWTPKFFSEIEPLPCSLLAQRFPDVPNLGDMTRITDEAIERFKGIDVVVAGTPCQSFSVAGLRKGMADPRGNLALVFLGLVDRIRPRWVVWENVAGILSSVNHDAPDARPPEIDLDGDDAPADGEEVVVADEYEADETHALACFLSGLQELGFGCAMRVLDAQYFGVPQRRRRVFVVGCSGDWRGAAAVLVERHSLSGDSAPSREKGPRVAALTSSGVGTCGADDSQAQTGHLIASTGDISHCLNAGEDGTGRGTPIIPILEAGKRCGTRNSARDGIGIGEEGDPMFTLQSGAQHAVAVFDERNVTSPQNRAACRPDDPVPTLHRSPLSIAFAHQQGGSIDLHMSEDMGLTLQKSQTQAICFSAKDCGGDASVTPIDMRQASHGATMTNNRAEGSSGGAPGTGIGEPGDPSPTISTSHVPAIAFSNGAPDAHVQMLEVRNRDDERSESGVDRGEHGERDSLRELHPLAFQTRIARNGRGQPEGICPTLQGAGAGATSDMRPCIADAMRVRRITPTEAERLQGFPDGWTDIPHRGKPAADGNRYRALGNSMAVPVLKWIGERIESVAKMQKEPA